MLHANAISERGDGVDVLELARALRLLGVSEITVAFLRDHPWNVQERIDELAAVGLSLLPYTRDSFRRLVRAARPTHFMAYSSGSIAGNVYSEDFPHRYRFGDYAYLTHAVFRNLHPHGDGYAYASDWLFDWAMARLGELSTAQRLRMRVRLPTLRFDTRIASLPFAVTVEEGDRERFRSALGIPAEAAVIGRIGGRSQFDDPVAQRAVEHVLASSPTAWFVGANTNRFLSHERAVFLPFLTRSRVHDFYAGIDVLLNGRLMGESFGFNIVEALKHDVPVIAPHLVRNPAMDAHHIELLTDMPGWLYQTSEDIVNQFERFRATGFAAGARRIVEGRFTTEELAAGLDQLAPH